MSTSSPRKVCASSQFAALKEITRQRDVEICTCRLNRPLSFTVSSPAASRSFLDDDKWDVNSLEITLHSGISLGDDSG